MNKKGLLHIYCGDGKGKTTAALGLGLRAAGNGMNVLIIQFLKGTHTSELETLKLIPNIKVIRCDRNYGFTFSMTEKDKAEITECHNKMLETAEKSNADLIILDEFCAAYKCGLLDREKAERLVLERSENTEMVLTGRQPHEKFTSAADYISEIHAVKHPYTQGISARKGIEY
ncbi:MAG: cob(I)yrinic acid a,c-diamide adenosyltransferase [Ruminococcus sp.]|nr:cob(I)yrinic acid a,c-diamide adenosyltransferase [Ruminococcus sp.]